MCGFAGQVGAPLAPETAARAATALEHRGPDAGGTWSDGTTTLVHRRLAIRDLTPAGQQPMVASTGSHVLAYNGELYAVDGLRRRLGVRRLRGTSDTELLVEACAEWGVDRVLPQLVGMFAFALWDTGRRELTLVRDRLGIKPLYWSAAGGVLRFASELGALTALGGPTGGLDPSALAAYLELNHLPGDLTPYHDVRRLRPGELLRLRGDGPRLEQWWQVGAALADASAQVGRIPEAEGLAALDEALATAVRDRLVADVPIGTLLSGGIDSSLVTALAVEAAPGSLRTFSVGFADRRHDESAHARAVAAHLGTSHTELQVTEADALALVPELPALFGEPFGDASAVPTALVFGLARREVTVALTGDGGDEVFGGYPRHWRTRRLIGLAEHVPSPLRRAIAGLAGAAARGASAPTAPARATELGRWLRKSGRVLAAPDTAAAHRAVLAQWPDPTALLAEPPTTVADGHRPSGPAWTRDPLDLLQQLDLAGPLPDDMLTKVDRTSMRVGLEARVPLLDHRVLHAAWTLPRHLRVDGGTGKVALRRLLDGRVPAALWDRPKQGFSVPLAAWLRGPLRAWAEDLLAPDRIASHGVLAVAPIRVAWDRHLSGAELADPLWGVLMLQAWLDHQRSRTDRRPPEGAGVGRRAAP